MTRIEAYKHMLEGKHVTHPIMPNYLWGLTHERKIVVDGSVSGWNGLFFIMSSLSDGWSLHEGTSKER